MTENTRNNAPPIPHNPRAIAARLLRQLFEGKSLSGLFETDLSAVPPRDIGLVKELCFGVARWHPRLEAIIRLLVRKPLKTRDNDVLALLYLGLYQLLYMRVATHAALAETVSASRSLGKPWATGLINAVLRSYLRDQETLIKQADKSTATRYAHPQWLAEAISMAWPDHWPAVLEANNQRPPMSLRINLARISRPDYFEQLRQAAIPASPIPFASAGIRLDRPLDTHALPGFATGLVSVQDGGAQLATELMDLTPGLRVLDACAAPGGKSGHILEKTSGQVRLTALDIDEKRLARVKDNLDRLGFSAHLSRGDASRPNGEWTDSRYHRILLDVPCSATGVIRRHPDIKLLRCANDIHRVTGIQARILDAIWPLLLPGGQLLYTTCSLLPEENQLQVLRFLQRTPDAREKPIAKEWGHPLHPGRQTLPGEATMDGFYYACLERG